MPPRLHLAIPPNIARHVISEIQSAFPDASIHPPQTHDEMDAFFKYQFGHPDHTADLTLTAYPSALSRAIETKDIFAPMPEGLPEMREELLRVGLREPLPFFKVAAVVTMLIIHHESVVPPVEGWADLCRDDLAAGVVIPPHNTPAPMLYAYYMEKLCGEEGRRASALAQAKLFPQDINKTVDEGTYKAGMVFPAFARTFRLGNARAVWPKEGAIAIPLLAFLRKDAPDEAVDVLKIVFSSKIQTIIAENGLFCPVREGIALFSEMAAHDSRLIWSGWEDYIKLAQLR